MKKALLSCLLLLTTSFSCCDNRLLLVQSLAVDEIDGDYKSRRTRFQQYQQQQADEWIKKYHHQSRHSDSHPRCPCSDSSNCEPIVSSTPIRESGEVYGFAAGKSTGEHYTWTHISTVAWANSDDLMCLAHQNGARVVLGSPSFNLTEIASLSASQRQSYIEDWVERTVFMVTSRHRDGVVFDYEEPLPRNSPEGKAYVDLINATQQVFHTFPTPLQVTTCVPWSPDDIDGRGYPYQDLAYVSDLLYVMDYDTQSQIVQGPCLANANAPYFGMKLGIERYVSLGIDPKKLILGMPWYGYQYPCLRGTQANDRFCPIQEVPFRGVNCSDAAGREVPYSMLLQEFYNQSAAERRQTRGMRRDAYMDATFFNLQRTNDVGDIVIYQNWMDDPTSLTHKTMYAKEMGLGGIGPYTFDDLDPMALPEESIRIWSTFDTFFSRAGNNEISTTKV